MSYQEKVHYYHAQLDKELSRYPVLNQLEARTQVPKTYAVLGVLGLFTSLIFFNIFAGFLSNLVGWLIPTYFSMKAIETPQSGDDIQWLTYWTVYGGFTVLENLVEPTVWFPYYFIFKTVFIVWLLLPSTKGAQQVYHAVVKPVITQAKSRFDSVSSSAQPTSE